FGYEIGRLDQLRFGVAAGDDDVQVARFSFERRDDFDNRQIVVPQYDVEFVEQHQPIRTIGQHRFCRLPGPLRRRDVTGTILSVPGKALAHRPAGHETAEPLERNSFAGAPSAFDELNYADSHAVTEASQDHAKGRGRLALALAGMDD